MEKFKPDYSKPRYKVIIEVFENCISFGFSKEKDAKISYHELISVMMESVRRSMMEQKRIQNKKEFKKHLKK